ncbi:MAG: ketol-acid reductoisomerase [bacterium]
MKPGSDEILICGFGSQGKAQALNLRDSGRTVAVSLRPESPRIAAAREAGLLVHTEAAAAAKGAGLAAVMLPDSEQPAYYNDTLCQNLPRGAALLFAHGFNVHYKRITPRPDLDVILVAPLAHGDAVRQGFLEHGAVPCVVAVAQDATGRARERAMEYARSIAGTGPFIDSTFAEEVETDLFVEQALLCGGMPELARGAFETLVNAGYNEEIAYFCCVRELKPIVDLLYRFGIAGMRSRISDTAAYGAATRGPRLAGDAMRAEMKLILDEIKSGVFSREITEEQGRGFSLLRESRERDAKHLIEKIHQRHGADKV